MKRLSILVFALISTGIILFESTDGNNKTVKSNVLKTNSTIDTVFYSSDNVQLNVTEKNFEN